MAFPTMLLLTVHVVNSSCPLVRTFVTVMMCLNRARAVHLGLKPNICMETGGV